MDELRVPFGAVRGAEQLQRLGGSGKGQGRESDHESSFDLPDPDQLVLVERALRKLEGKEPGRITEKEAEAVKQVCWEKARTTAEYFLKASGPQKDYPSSALRRLLHVVDRCLRRVREVKTEEDPYGPEVALTMLGTEIYHLARTTSKPEVKPFFTQCGDLAKTLADHRPRPTGRGLEVFLERVICFAERGR